MQSMKTDDWKYRILLDGERFPVEIGRGKWEMTVYHFGMALEDLRIQIKSAYDEDDALYKVFRTILDNAGLHCSDGKVSELDNLSYAFQTVQNIIEESSDTVPAREEIETLEDIGFHRHWNYDDFYEKVIEDTDEKEVVEEVVFIGDFVGVIHRLRTTIWDTSKYGKSSREILYDVLPIDDDLQRHIDNTLRERKED